MNFDEWIGRAHEAEDLLTEGLLARYRATIGCIQTSQIAPPGIHWCLCLPDTPIDELGEDGHPKKGGFLPPIPYPRRMWASSRVKFVHPLLAGDRVRRKSTIKNIKAKKGSSGDMVFVEVEHLTFANGELSVDEVQTLVYRAASNEKIELPDNSPSVHGQDPDRDVITPTPQLLFRYSALTFNTHRIHYDADYAKSVEGYPRPVVQGPLMASLILHFASKRLNGAPIAEFSFRGRAPAYCGQKLHLGFQRGDGQEAALEILGPDGNTVMTASLKTAEPG